MGDTIKHLNALTLRSLESLRRMHVDEGLLHIKPEERPDFLERLLMGEKLSHKTELMKG